MAKKVSPYTKYDEWVKQFQPVRNEGADIDDEYDGCLFPNRSERVEKTEPHYIWTLITDDNDRMCIIQGWHYTNREGYFITENPWKDGDNFNIYDEDDIKAMERIEKRSKGFTVVRTVPAITEGLERYNYGENDWRNERTCEFILAWFDEDKTYVLLDKDNERSLNEDYDTPQQAVDHAYRAFGGKIINTKIENWVED